MAQAGSGAKVRAYRVLHLLGRGGFGDVYLAQEDGRVPRPRQFAIRVAAEALTADARHMVRIQKVALALSYANIAGAHRYDSVTRIDGRWTLVSEHLEGITARDLLAESYPPPAVALQVVEQAAQVLHHLSGATDRKGRQLHLIHRDLKPSNLLLTPTGEVRLLDFGLARKEFVAAEAIGGDPSFGNLQYQAPERGQSTDTQAVDVHALGMTLIALLLGGTPAGQPGPTRPEAHADRMRKLDGLLASAKIGVGIRALIREATAADPARRPSPWTFARVCRSLRSAHKDQPLQQWVQPRIQAVLRAQSQPPGPLTGSVLEDTSSSGRRARRVTPVPASVRPEQTPPTEGRMGGRLAQAPAPLDSPPTVDRVPMDRAAPQALRAMTLQVARFEEVGDDATVIRRGSLPPSLPPIGDLPTREGSPTRSRTPGVRATPASLDSTPFLHTHAEATGDPATVIRRRGAAPLPSDFGIDDTAQESTIIRPPLAQQILNQQETREMAPPRDGAPLVAETTAAEPLHPDLPGEAVPLWRRWWVTAGSVAAVGVAAVTILGGISAFLGGSAVFSGIVMNLVTASVEQRCATNVDIGRDFVQQVRLRPRRDALALLDDLEGECVAGRIGFWGTVLVIVELRNWGEDGILNEYEQHKVREVIREWSE